MSLYLTGVALDFILYIPIMLLVFISFYYFQEKVGFGQLDCSFTWLQIFKIVFGYKTIVSFFSTTIPHLVVDKMAKNIYLFLIQQ
tara:strand:+ start:256 stop:510 length:255 start_codon:yes stop_codon:yes gene_type:complete